MRLGLNPGCSSRKGWLRLLTVPVTPLCQHFWLGQWASDLLASCGSCECLHPVSSFFSRFQKVCCRCRNAPFRLPSVSFPREGPWFFIHLKKHRRIPEMTPRMHSVIVCRHKARGKTQAWDMTLALSLKVPLFFLSKVVLEGYGSQGGAWPKQHDLWRPHTASMASAGSGLGSAA